MDPVALLKGALPPILAALLLVSLWGARLLPLAAALGLYVAYGLLKDWPPLPSTLWRDPNGTAWLVWGVAALASVSSLERLGALPARVGAVLGAAAASGALWLMLSKVAMRWDAGEVALHVGGGAAAAALGALAVRDVLARAPRSAAPAILFTVLLSFDAVLVTLGKSALLGQLCGAVAAALGASVATGLWRRGGPLVAADGAWLGGAHVLFVLAGFHLGYLEVWPAACALASVLPLWGLRPVACAGSARWLLVRAPLPLALMGLATWLALPTPGAYGY